MAVYNGFSTRKKEAVYNELTFELMRLMQEQIFMKMTGQECDMEKWGKDCKNTLRRLNRMEGEKFMNPKYSATCKELGVEIGLNPSKKASPEKDLPIIHGISHIVSITKLSKKKITK